MQFWQSLEAGGFNVSMGETHSPLPGTPHWNLEYFDPDLKVFASMDLFVLSMGVDLNDGLPKAQFRLHSLPMMVTSEALNWIRRRASQLEEWTAPRVMHEPGAHDAPLVAQLHFCIFL